MRRRRGRGYSGYSGYRRRRSAGKTAAIILAVILGIALLIGILFFAVRIKEIDVTGNKQYTEEEIIDLLFDEKWSMNSAYCYYENQFREKKSIPFIEDYKIEFQSPTKVRVVVYEKSVVGYAVLVLIRNVLADFVNMRDIEIHYGIKMLHGASPLSCGCQFDYILNYNRCQHFHQRNIFVISDSSPVQAVMQNIITITSKISQNSLTTIHFWCIIYYVFLCK